jgi:hypothetical protein
VPRRRLKAVPKCRAQAWPQRRATARQGAGDGQRDARVRSGRIELAPDRLLYNYDLHHNHHPGVMAFRMLCPQPLQFLGSKDWLPPEKMAVDHESILHPAFLDGCMYLRSQAGAQHCYDLLAAR